MYVQPLPEGYAYVPEPGLTHDDGQLRQLAPTGGTRALD